MGSIDDKKQERERKNERVKHLLFDILFLTTIIIVIIGVSYKILLQSNTVYDKTSKTDTGFRWLPDISLGNGETQIPYIYYIVGLLAFFTIVIVFWPAIQKVWNRTKLHEDFEVGDAGIRTQEAILKKDSREWGNETSLVLAAEALGKRIIVMDPHPDPHADEEYREVQSYGKETDDKIYLLHESVSGEFGINDHYNLMKDNKVIKVVGDGRCRFRALAESVYDDENRYEDIRKTMRMKFHDSKAKRALEDFQRTLKG